MISCADDGIGTRARHPATTQVPTNALSIMVLPRLAIRAEKARRKAFSLSDTSIVRTFLHRNGTLAGERADSCLGANPVSTGRAKRCPVLRPTVSVQPVRRYNGPTLSHSQSRRASVFDPVALDT